LRVPGLKTNIVVGVIYRHSNNDVHSVNDFIEAFDKKINEIDSFKNNVYILGNINLNIQSGCRTPNANNYLSMMVRNGLDPIITQPSKVVNDLATLIDRIFTSTTNNLLFPGILRSDISDHYNVLWNPNLFQKQ